MRPPINWLLFSIALLVLFANLADGRLQGHLVPEGPGSYAEAMYERDVFGYLPADAADHTAISTTTFQAMPSGPYVFPRSSLHQFEIARSQEVWSTAWFAPSQIHGLF